MDCNIGMSIIFYQAPEKMRMKKRVGSLVSHLDHDSNRVSYVTYTAKNGAEARRVSVCVCLDGRRQNVGKSAGVLMYKRTGECGGWWDRE